MIIRAIVNQFDYLVEDERFLRYDVKKIYAPVGGDGAFQTVEQIITILLREQHIDICLIDQTAIPETEFLTWLWTIRKQIGEHIRIVPVVVDETRIPSLVHKQFNQFFVVDQQAPIEIQVFTLFGLLVNPRTVADVEAWLTPKTMETKEEKRIRMVKVPEIIQLPATKQQRIAFVGLVPQVGTTTICLELAALLEAQEKCTQLVSFDQKIGERSEKQVELRQISQFLEAELQLFQSEAEYIIYDCTANELALLKEQASLFNQVYYVLSYNYPLLLEHAQTIQTALKGKGTFVLNQHQTLPKIDANLRKILMLQPEQQIKTLPVIERDTIIRAEMQRAATHEQQFQQQLAELIGLTQLESPKPQKLWSRIWQR